jgi:hypothetical protein
MKLDLKRPKLGSLHSNFFKEINHTNMLVNERILSASKKSFEKNKTVKMSEKPKYENFDTLMPHIGSRK